jgi:hypothetical protein
MTDHRWSGWPGAWCLDCGCGDPAEDAVCDTAFDVYEGKWDSPEAEAAWQARNSEALAGCPSPGSNKHNPYFAKSVPKEFDL